MRHPYPFPMKLPLIWMNEERRRMQEKRKPYRFSIWEELDLGQPACTAKEKGLGRWMPVDRGWAGGQWESYFANQTCEREGKAPAGQEWWPIAGGRFPLPSRFTGRGKRRGRERFLLVQWDPVLDQLISQTSFDPLIPTDWKRLERFLCTLPMKAGNSSCFRALVLSDEFEP